MPIYSSACLCECLYENVDQYLQFSSLIKIKTGKYLKDIWACNNLNGDFLMLLYIIYFRVDAIANDQNLPFGNCIGLLAISFVPDNFSKIGDEMYVHGKGD